MTILYYNTILGESTAPIKRKLFGRYRNSNCVQALVTVNSMHNYCSARHTIPSAANVQSQVFIPSPLLIDATLLRVLLMHYWDGMPRHKDKLASLPADVLRKSW